MDCMCQAVGKVDMADNCYLKALGKGKEVHMDHIAERMDHSLLLLADKTEKETVHSSVAAEFSVSFYIDRCKVHMIDFVQTKKVVEERNTDCILEGRILIPHSSYKSQHSQID